MNEAPTSRLRMAGPLLSLEQAAALLGVTGSTLRQRIRVGHLDAFRHGRRYFIARKWLEQYRVERHRKPGRPRATRSLQEEFSTLLAEAMCQDLPADFAALDELFFAAARRLVLAHPRTEPAALLAAMEASRLVLVDCEAADQRRRALEALVERVCREERYRAGREAARSRPYALGQRWRTLLREHLAAMVGDPRRLGSLPRVDVAIALELAAEVRRHRPTINDADLTGLLASAMLEGSESLPDAPGACQDLIESTVEAACPGVMHTWPGLPEKSSWSRMGNRL